MNRWEHVSGKTYLYVVRSEGRKRKEGGRREDERHKGFPLEPRGLVYLVASRTVLVLRDVRCAYSQLRVSQVWRHQDNNTEVSDQKATDTERKKAGNGQGAQSS